MYVYMYRYICIYIYMFVSMCIHMLQDFPCPITLGQWEACDWTGEGRQSKEVRRQGERSEEEKGNQNGG